MNTYFHLASSKILLKLTTLVLLVTSTSTIFTGSLPKTSVNIVFVSRTGIYLTVEDGNPNTSALLQGDKEVCHIYLIKYTSLLGSRFATAN